VEQVEQEEVLELELEQGVWMCVVMWRSEWQRCGWMGLEFSTNADWNELGSVAMK